MSKPNAPKEGDGYHSGRKTPKPEKVTTLTLNHNDDVRQAAVDRQNISDQKKDKGWRAQVPGSRKLPTTTSSGN